MKRRTNRRLPSFNDAGLPFQQTSLTNYDQSVVENQVEDVYNGYGQLIQQYQEPYGAVNTSTSPSVQYGYTQAGNYSRLASMTYPNGRVLDYGYNSGIDDAISRISYQADGGGSSAGVHLADYTYLGLSTIVAQNSPEANTELTYIQQPGDGSALTDGGDRYTGLDRFGRVDDQYWLNTLTNTPVDRIQYGYDRDGNTLYANNLVNGTFSELYHANSSTSGDNNTGYDPLSRLTSFSRGTLTSSGNNGSSLDTITSANLNATSNVPNQNSWNYDSLGNCLTGNGASNTFNSQNEEATNGSNTLAYDNAGDMTTDEIGNTYVFDAWGHVVQIKNSAGASLETFQFDALGRNDLANNNGSNVRQTYDAAGRQIEAAFGTVYAQQVWGLAYVNDIIVRDRDADGNLSTGNLGVNGSGLEEREYAQHDKQFSVISLTNQTGTVIQRLAYDPYGKFTVLTATWTYDTTGGGTNYWFVLFQGMSFVADGASGNLMQSQTRFYDVNVGRWTSQDWWGYLDGSNSYLAVNGNPTSLVDPTGGSWTGLLRGGGWLVKKGISFGKKLAKLGPEAVPWAAGLVETLTSNTLQYALEEAEARKEVGTPVPCPPGRYPAVMREDIWQMWYRDNVGGNLGPEGGFFQDIGFISNIDKLTYGCCCTGQSDTASDTGYQSDPGYPLVVPRANWNPGHLNAASFSDTITVYSEHKTITYTCHPTPPPPPNLRTAPEPPQSILW